MSCYDTVDHCIECADGFQKMGWKCVSENQIKFVIALKVQDINKFRKSDYLIRN